MRPPFLMPFFLTDQTQFFFFTHVARDPFRGPCFVTAILAVAKNIIFGILFFSFFFGLAFP